MVKVQGIGTWLLAIALAGGCSKKTGSKDEPPANPQTAATPRDAAPPRVDAAVLESNADYLRYYRPALFGDPADTIPIGFDELFAHAAFADGEKRNEEPTEADLLACEASLKDKRTVGADGMCALGDCRLVVDDGFRPTAESGAAVAYGRAVKDGELLFLQYYLLFPNTGDVDSSTPPLLEQWFERNRRTHYWRESRSGEAHTGGVEMIQIVLRRRGDAYVPEAIDLHRHHYAASMPWPQDSSGTPYAGRPQIHITKGVHTPYVDAERHGDAVLPARCLLADDKIAAIPCLAKTPHGAAPIAYTLELPPEDALVFQWRGYLGEAGDLERYVIDDGPPMAACRATDAGTMWHAPSAYHAAAVVSSTLRLRIDAPPLHYWNDEAKPALARELNRKALALHTKGNYAAALPLYLQALDADPRHILARYNLACALSMDGQSDEALFVLEQLRVAGCKQCVAQLAHARKDTDLEALWKHARFRALTGPVDAEVIAGAVDMAFNTGDYSHIADFVPETGTVRYVNVCSLCPPEADGGTDKRLDAAGVRALVREVYRDDQDVMSGGDGPGYGGFENPTCSKGCCSRRGSLSHSSVFLSTVCVKPGTQQLKSITMVDGG